MTLRRALGRDPSGDTRAEFLPSAPLMLRFTWDAEKAAVNLRKHQVDFHEALTAFGDPLSITIPDSEHSIGEERWLLLGLSAGGLMLVVAHTESQNEIRIISARLATRREREIYEEDR